jgi:hypothetical protein
MTRYVPGMVVPDQQFTHGFASIYASWLYAIWAAKEAYPCCGTDHAPKDGKAVESPHCRANGRTLKLGVQLDVC